MKPDRPTCWEAQFDDVHGRPFTLRETATNECPVSMLHFNPQVAEFIQLFARAKSMREFGASYYGADLNKWPARTVDAFVILQQMDNKINNLRMTPAPQQQAARGKGRR